MGTQQPLKIGKYDILDVLGRGGMGVVYRARDPRLGRIVAIKMLTEGYSGHPDMLQRFYREASQTGALRHNNIVVVFDAGDQNGEPYIVMEYVEGEPLDRRIKRQPIELELAVSIVEQVCLAIAYAHRNGVVHRDIKPANIILQREGTAKLLDFGIARDEARLDTSLTSTGALVGTPPYMAPERFRGAPLDGRSDIFSAGVLLYLLITGTLPFDAEYPRVIEQILRLDPPPPSELCVDCPPALDAIVARALAKSPGDRYDNGDDMAMDLHEANESITRARIGEWRSLAEQQLEAGELLSAQSSLRQLMGLDPQNVAGKRLLSQVEQRLSQQGRERKAQELTRLGQQAAAQRDWDRALAICDEAMNLSPSSVTLASLRKAATEGKQKQERVSRLLQESEKARRAGELTRAQAHAASAQQLDPGDSQVLALCRALEQEIEEKRIRSELRILLASVHQHLEERALEQASILLAEAEALAPSDADVLRARDELTARQSEEQRKVVVRKLEEKLAGTTTPDKLRTVSIELTNALNDFPNDPSLLWLRFNLEPRIKKMEEDQLVREAGKSATELPPEEALTVIRAALARVPKNEQLISLESAIADRVARQAREHALAERLTLARQAIDSRLYLKAVKFLERCQEEGFSSYEINGLLELAKSAAAQQISQEVRERALSRATQLMEEEDYENAVQLLRRAMSQGDDPVLQSQLDEAIQKQAELERNVATAHDRAERLIGTELFAEAVSLLENQPPRVKRVPEIAEALTRAHKLQQDDANFAFHIGRCYGHLGNPQGIADMQKALNAAAPADASPAEDSMRKQLRRRSEKIYGERASTVIAAARALLSQDDSQGAGEVLAETTPWVALAPVKAQEELRELHAEAASAKKVLRFRRGGWR